MALPTLNDGYEVTDVEWNAHVTEINRLLDKPHARYYQSADQSLTTGDNIAIQLDTALDTHPAIVPSGAGNTDFTLNRAGVWVLSGACRFEGNAGGGERFAGIRLDGLGTITFDASYPAGGAASVAVSTTRRFQAGDTIRLNVFQTSGNTIMTESAGFEEGIHLGMTWVAP